MERQKTKMKKGIWAGLGMRKVEMMETRMARLQVRLNTRVPRSQNRVGNFKYKSKIGKSALTICFAQF